jgi:hypothetical protein
MLQERVDYLPKSHQDDIVSCVCVRKNHVSMLSCVINLVAPTFDDPVLNQSSR